MKENSNTTKVIKGVSSQTVVTISLGVVEILYFSVMSRILSREDFGVFAAISAITIIFYSISDAGIGSALIQRKDLTEKFKNTAFSLSLIVGAVCTIVMIVLAQPLAILILDERLIYPLMFMSLTIFINNMSSISYGWMYRNLQFLRAGIISLISLVISSVLAIVLAYHGYGYYAIIVRALLSTLLSMIISYFIINTKFKYFINKEDVKSILNFGGWLTASVIIHNISSQIDRLLMSRLISLESLGSYNRPKEFIIQVGSRVNNIFDTALFPVLSSIQDEKESLRNAFNRSLCLINLLSMGMSLTFICNSELIIRIFFGEKWIDLDVLFKVISITLIFNINGRLGDCYLRSLGLVKQQFALRSFELILDIICIVVGAQFGIIGVAIGFLVGNITLISIKSIYIVKVLGISISVYINNLFSSWLYGIYYVPLIICEYYIFPHTLFNNIILLFLFLVESILLFLVFPQLVGQHYKEEIFQKIYSYIFKK